MLLGETRGGNSKKQNSSKRLYGEGKPEKLLNFLLTKCFIVSHKIDLHESGVT